MLSVNMKIKDLQKFYKRKLPSLKKKLFGMHLLDGLVYKIIMYFLLTVLGFVFIYPIIYMFSTSLMSNIDLVDNTINWIPSKINLTNYKLTIRALNIPKSYLTSFFIVTVSTICVAFASALIGFGLARYHFKGKKLVFAIMIFSFIMPKTLFFIPTYQIYTFLRIKGTLAAILVPALTGQGLQGPFFILIFYQFFLMIPKPLIEAAIIDGAKPFTIFYKIAIPMAIPAFIITFVYGFALYWNETFLLGAYLDGKYKTVTMLLSNLQDHYGSIIGDSGLDPSRSSNLSFTEAKSFAGTLLAIVPLMIMYIFVQRWFVESIDKSGITGE